MGESELVAVEVDFAISGQRVHGRIPVPRGPTEVRELLPAIRALAETVVDAGVRAAEARGERVSCRAGCGACCRQLVPISEVEARLLADLIETLPEPRRGDLRERFAAARDRLASAGLLVKLEHPEGFPDRDLHALGLAYFELGITCPFLEDESCSIYAERPIACREYLVTTPAEHCAQPSGETVRMVPLAGKASTALARLNEDGSARFVPWVPLILAPAWAEGHREPPRLRPGPELLREFFARLAEPPRGASSAQEAPPAG
jgi:Fe-S-cluster containining protein